MKAQMKAIGATAIVVALALVAVSGVTYSWFSDTETSNIEVSTAKVDIDGKYVGTPVVEKLDGGSVSDTEAEFINGNKDISITNMLPNRSVSANYELTNNSSVSIKYRMYVIVSGIDDNLAEKSVKITPAAGNALILNSSLDFDKGVAYVTLKDGVIINDKGPFGFKIEISFSDDVTSASGFSIKIYNEAYQYDFEYGSVTAMTGGSANLPKVTDQTTDVRVIGKTGAEAGVEAADVEVTFSAGAYNTITDNGSKQVSLKTTMLSSYGNEAKIQLSLEGTVVSDFGGDYVTVSLTIPGVFTDLNVVYPAGGSQPVIISCTNDGTNTVIVFKTTHFSDYVIYKDKLYVDSESMLGFALSNGIDAVLAKDITVEDTVVATTKCTLDLNSYGISNNVDIWNNKDDVKSWSLISVRDNGDLTIIGNGTLQARENDCYAVDIQDGSRCTIKGGKYVGNIHAVYILEGSLFITGGEYSVQQKYSVVGKEDEFVINCYDANREAGTAKVQITGGTYVSFNPADCWAEGEHTNFVADGYTSTKNGDNYVVSEAPITVSQGDKVSYFADLNSALVYIKGLNGSDSITVTFHKSGTYLWTTNIENSGSINFVTDVEGVIIDLSNASLVQSDGGRLIYADNDELSFSKVSLRFDSNAYAGFARAKSINYNNCTINGMYTAYGTTEVFKDCTFIASSKDSECVYSSNWGTKNMTFTGCTFYAGKYAIDVYANLEGDERSLVINGCKFYNLHQFDGSVGEYELVKSAVRMKACSAGVWNVTIADCENLGRFVKESNHGETIASADGGLWSFVIGGDYGVGSTANINGETYLSNATSGKS